MSQSDSEQKKLVMLTCYDATFAKLVARTQKVDYVLVGDSIGMVLYGEDTTTGVKTEVMAAHTRAVRKGFEQSASNELPVLIGDMPARSYESPDQAVQTAMALVDAGADVVKLEGPMIEQVKSIRSKSIRVCGHIGLTPQTAASYRLQGKSSADAERLKKEAQELEAAGVELLVLEMIPSELSDEITQMISIPTIGIGAGAKCSGQVLVIYDMLGMNADFKPRFLKNYMNGAELISEAIGQYSDEVREGKYPAREHSYFSSSS